VGLAFSDRGSLISAASYQKIELGMTKAQVEERLGGPPRWDVKPKSKRYIDPDDLGNVLRVRPDEWWGRDGIIQVWYKDGIVCQKDHCAHRLEVVPFTIWDRLTQLGPRFASRSDYGK
jgi:hypothetical protein